MLKYINPIIDMNKPVHPIIDMVNQVREYRNHHSKMVLDWILEGFMADHLSALKEGPVEFVTTRMCVLPDGSEYIYDHTGIMNLIIRAEHHGIDLTYKVNPYDVSEDIVWILDIKEIC